MNHCRTCKYWAVRAHMIGCGACMNASLISRMIVPTATLIFTSGDFGCVLHEEGESSLSLEGPQEIKEVRREFIAQILGDPKNL